MNMQQVGQPRSSTEGYGHHKIRDRLIYITTCLIGHQVEVQVVDGSVFSGIFHAINAEDFGMPKYCFMYFV